MYYVFVLWEIDKVTLIFIDPNQAFGPTPSTYCILIVSYIMVLRLTYNLLLYYLYIQA